jgi:hypothetical protein
MVDIWDKHGPPSFVTLAAAHLKPKKNSKGAKAATESEEKKTGTMADLAAQLGMGSSKTRVTF